MIKKVQEGQPFQIEQPEDGDAIVRHLKGRVTRAGHDWIISRMVGHLKLGPNRFLQISSPKASNASLLCWMAYADPQMRSLQRLCDLPEAADEGDLTGALAWLFCQQLLLTARQNGLLRRYQEQLQVSGAVRGRIAFQEMTRRYSGQHRIPCHSHERVFQTKLNQILAAAFEVIRRDPWLRQAAGQHFDRCASLLESITPRIDQGLLSGRDTLNRLESAYEPLLNLSRLLLNGNALGEGQAQRGIGFVLNLESLFEQTVTRVFQEAGIPHREQVPLPYARAGHQPGGCFHMDVLILGDPPVVVDAKFKSSVSSGNLQQMVTYCLMSGAQQAVLVFPSGHLGDRRSYRIPLADGREVVVHVVELDTSGKSLAEWRCNASRLLEHVQTVIATESVAKESIKSLLQSRKGAHSMEILNGKMHWVDNKSVSPDPRKVWTLIRNERSS